jgi:hypothetical protein
MEATVDGLGDTECKVTTQSIHLQPLDDKHTYQMSPLHKAQPSTFSTRTCPGWLTTCMAFCLFPST